MSNLTHPTLQDLVLKKFIPADALLMELLVKASQREDALIFAGHLLKRNVDYISPACEKILGYSTEEFVNGGAEFIFSHTEAEWIPGIIEAEMGYIKKAKQPGFDPGAIDIHRFDSVMRPAHGPSIKIICLGVVLNYNEHADMENGFAFLAIDRPETLLWCADLLTKIKRRHNQVYQHVPIITNQSIEAVGNEKKPLTSRELEILKFLGNGLTSTEIGQKLSIEENTVESHRKNMLVKFEAKNVAELIKKASKLYWLE